jgi:hypothetical protein
MQEALEGTNIFPTADNVGAYSIYISDTNSGELFYTFVSLFFMYYFISLQLRNTVLTLDVLAIITFY